MIFSLSISLANAQETDRSSNKVNQTSKLIRFDDHNLGISFSYPSTWILKRNDDNVSIGFNGPDNTYMGILVIRENKTLEEYTKEIVQQRRDVFNLTVLNLEPMEIAGGPGYIAVFRGVHNPVSHSDLYSKGDVPYISLLTINANKFVLADYISPKVTFQNWSNNLSELLNVTSTIELIKSCMNCGAKNVEYGDDSDSEFEDNEFD